MKWLADSLIAIVFFFLCINGGLWIVGNALNVQFVKESSINFNELKTSLNGTQQDLQAAGGFNIDFIFGDWSKQVNTGWKLLSGGYVLDTLRHLGFVGFNDDFDIVMEVLMLFMMIGAGLYWIGGRQ